MTYQKPLSEIEDSIAHLGRCSSAWWKAAQAITGKRMVELLEEMGDRWNPENSGLANDGIDIDKIINDAMNP
ncbi:hypothetical protein D1823_13315 [Ruegeria sp. AD91A]|uniref:hypothetical protein n=1 Tax=Ruegeria sp. AD91A TaxID=2293862 RepID=UPI000E52E611|nr:hypothetical protein [Ruegeria sp. AD91A]AXT27468.1 hypothetical protein D1823_13315 [Ruegeria sp. AD91A]